jgi:transposase InsO family protein
VIRLKAWMPEAGCRRIAIVFNQLHEQRRGMTISKSFVARYLQHRQEKVMRKRRQLRRRKLFRTERNRVWALDLTKFTATDEPVLGVIDHGSRACLELRKLESKRSFSILRVLFDLIDDFGKPKAIRTDNEAVFTSALWRLALAILGIRHQQTMLHAPWQNGRIERDLPPAEIEATLAELDDEEYALLASQLRGGLSAGFQVSGWAITLLPDEVSFTAQAPAGWVSASDAQHLVLLEVG